MPNSVAESRRHFENHFGGAKSLRDVVKRSSKTPKTLREGDDPLEDRDLFAMHAIPGIISWMEQGRINEDWSDWTMEDIADHAYELADAMLKSRQKKNKGR
ncbi:hypothetical protein PVS_46 [Vibrio phage vB_VspS_VS-ABTNL-3]|nr:hypothetical protein PVS_46 [Vibrio phage vB_VspS_VS-ABTNL-3]